MSTTRDGRPVFRDRLQEVRTADRTGERRAPNQSAEPRSPNPSTESATRGRADEPVAFRPAARRSRWRVVDIVVASVLGVAAGVVFWAWGLAWTPLSAALVVVAPMAGLLAGGWLFAAVLGALVIRKPGAALFTEVVAGVVSMAIGTQWGFSVLLWAALQGLAVELVFAGFRYRRWTLWVVLLAGAAAGVAVGLLDTTFTSSAAWGADWKLLYIGCAVVSGVLVAGLLSWVAVRALARTGALAPFAAGRTARQV